MTDRELALLVAVGNAVRRGVQSNPDSEVNEDFYAGLDEIQRIGVFLGFEDQEVQQAIKEYERQR